MKTDAVWRTLPRRIREKITKEELEHVQEIRLRSGQPVLFREENRQFRLLEGVGPVSAADLRETISLLSAYSLYAFEEELRQGYLTIEGGHRVGFCGKAVMEQGEIKTLRQINALNIRIAKERKGWAERLLPDLAEHVCHTLIVSPPGCGKTTLLRDMVRCISNGMQTVGVVDERGEICPLRDGVPQMDVGRCTDILEGCPKAKGMVLLLRSMCPDVIAVDELGRQEDVHAVQEVLNCGVRLIATAHGSDFNDIKERPHLGSLVERKVFERYLFLSNRKGTGTLETLLDREGNIIRKGDEV